MADTTIDLPVLGMTCAACVRRVEQAALKVPGVTSAEVNLPLSRARLALAGESIAATGQSAAAAIRAAGYEVPADALDQAPGERRLAAIGRAHEDERAGLRRDAILAIVATVPLLAIAMTHVVNTPIVIAQIALGTLVVLGPGMRYVRAGMRAALHRNPDMNTLIALGAGAAWVSSLVAGFRWLAGDTPHASLYFEAGAAIVAFVMIGKLLEARARSQLADAVRGILSLAPERAHRLADGEERDVLASELVAGDTVRVRPGERLPADGTVVEGASAVEEALLTGEALPVDKEAGSPVYAGTLNSYGALVVRIARAGGDTALARIARAVEDAQGAKAPIARIADRVSAVFVPIVLVIAAGTAIGWGLAGATTSDAIEHAVAVLVIACPCALGLATPAAVAVGTARGAELGVLFRDGVALETASRITVACLDKTGTLTAGMPVIVGEPEREMLRLAASAELASEHPIARAIVDGAKARSLALASPEDAKVEPGAGISARVEGKRVLVGTREFLALATIALPVEQHEPDTMTCHVAIDGVYAGWFAIADVPAASARDAIARLTALGIRAVMVTGDREPVARSIADQVGITEIHAGVRPTGKAAIVGELRGAQRVAMVGDGINDAPALAAADLGIALGSGTDIAVASADVTLLRGGIAALPVVFVLARATLRTIRRNLLAASFYNLVCIPVAAAGLLSPVVASAAMSLSSVSVLISSLALRRTSPNKQG
jgi:Cu+-exporting ATPase